MYPFRKSLTAAALLATMSSAAHAYEFFTPVSQSQVGATMYCAIVNVGSTPAVVSANVLSMVDGSDITALHNCVPSPGTLPPGHACFGYTDQNNVSSGYCHFTSSTTKVRADLIVFGSTGEVLTTIPATR
jgi:hypothetical protein